MSLESDIMEVFGNVPEYGMFSTDGNLAVGNVIDISRSNKLNWSETLSLLSELAKSNPKKFGEAMDTVVREYVYDALGFDSDFYI